MFRSGHVFVCTSRTEHECFGRSLFGAPMSKWKEIREIRGDTAIFLFKRTATHPIMYGVFLADSQPGQNLEPLAWGGKCPAQVRVKQYYKFCPLPWTAFKKLVRGNSRVGKTGFQLTREQTLDLITKFIVTTRLDLGHRIMSRLSGGIGKHISSKWLTEKHQFLHTSSSWQKDLMGKDQPGFRFVPECMPQKGTINDFILAIRRTSSGKCMQEGSKIFSEDWKQFMMIFAELIELNSYCSSGDLMEDLFSLLSQESSTVWPDTSNAEIHAAEEAAAVRKWFGSPSSNRSVVRNWEEPVLSQVPKQWGIQRPYEPDGLLSPLPTVKTKRTNGFSFPYGEKMSLSSSPDSGNYGFYRGKYDDIAKHSVMDDLFLEESGNLPFYTLDGIRKDDFGGFNYLNRDMYSMNPMRITEENSFFPYQPKIQPTDNSIRLYAGTSGGHLQPHDMQFLQDMYLNDVRLTDCASETQWPIFETGAFETEVTNE